MVSDSLDTCVILSFIQREPEEQYNKAWELLEDGSRHHIADLAISETVYVLEAHRKIKRTEIARALQSFFEQFDDVLEYNRNLYELVLPFYEKHPTLSFNDCCMAFYAELNNAEPLWTFDKDLAKKHASAKLLQ